MQKLLYVIDSLAPGGAERSFAAMVPGFVARGLEVDVAYLHERPGIHDQLRVAGARLHAVPGSGRVQWSRGICSLVRSRRPELVHTTLFEADVTGRVAARLAGTPCVTSLVNETYGAEHRADPAVSTVKLRAAQVVDAATCRLASRFHAVSEHVASTMSRNLFINPSKIEVIPRGRDSDALGRRSSERSATTRRALGLTAEDFVVVVLARHEYQKGLDVLVDALPAMRVANPRVRVLVAGREGAETQALRDQAAGLRCADLITLLGARDDVADLLCAADVFVLPSRREGMPGSVIEAMATEVPIVATDLAQTREAVPSEMAMLVPPDDPSALAHAVMEVASDRDAAQARAHQARARFEELFTIDSVVDRMLAFYDRALATA
jgi:glycosyltransferase involved in cell wall biosynthesis